jgi:hypothetical protein
MRAPLALRCTLFLVLALCGAEAHAAPAAPVPVATATPVFAEGWKWSKIYAPIESGLSSRARMVQLGSLGMVIALFIIWWRK